MSSERFSRLLEVNTWLSNWTKETGLQFINNFDLFWKRDFLFDYISGKLNKLGSVTLANTISSHMSDLLD